MFKRENRVSSPFVLHSQPIAISQESSERLNTVAADTHQRYAEIMRDVENLILDHSKSSLASRDQIIC
jgi:hypothetical protein